MSERVVFDSLSDWVMPPPASGGAKPVRAFDTAEAAMAFLRRYATISEIALGVAPGGWPICRMSDFVAVDVPAITDILTPAAFRSRALAQIRELPPTL
jgi:hypothetical protein